MSRGIGRIQRECLRALGAATEPLNTFAITADVYQIKPDTYDNRMCNDAQHTAVKRALAGLRRKGLVVGRQDVRVKPDGTKLFLYNRQHRDGSYSMHAERCCLWSIVGREFTTEARDGVATDLESLQTALSNWKGR
jgi:hypothetical protein